MIRAALLAAALIAASGCGQRALVEHDGLRFDERRERLSEIPSWQMRGRIAVDTGERAFQASFRWEQDGDVSTLVVRAGPFGAGAVEVTGSPEEMIVTARGERHVLEDPETDLSALLGWWMPVESLRAWLLGLPDAAYEAETRIGPTDVLVALDQRLWRLDYDGYQLAEGLLVPRRIDMTYDELGVRLTVDDWTIRSLNSTASEQHNTALGAALGRWGVAKR
jgi:outer membrane lipoprotein LolB